MARTTYRTFLSAVTRELGSYRTEVARVLQRKKLVRDQEHFRQGPAALLEQPPEGAPARSPGREPREKRPPPSLPEPRRGRQQVSLELIFAIW